MSLTGCKFLGKGPSCTHIVKSRNTYWHFHEKRIAHV